MAAHQFHMPNWRLRHNAHAATHAEHHHEPLAKKMRRIEGAMDYMIVAGIVLLGAAMAYGLLTASGESAWF